MKAVQLHAFGGVDQFHLEDVPDPVPGTGEVLVRLAVSGLNPVDSYARQGYTRQMFPIDVPAILGCDGAGTVEAVGEGVAGFEPGQRVVIHLPPGGHGTHAELAVAPVAGVAHLPGELTYEQGATLPLVGLTGRQLVDELGGVSPGDRVLVAGALGAVGRAAVQYLRELGAVPVAGVRAERVGEGEALAGEALDIGATPEGPGFDFAIAAAGPVAANTAAHLRDGGRLASAVQVPEEVSNGGRIDVRPILTHDDGPMLQAVVDAAARSDLEIPVDETFPLTQLSEAHKALEAGPSGKILVIH